MGSGDVMTNSGDDRIGFHFSLPFFSPTFFFVLFSHQHSETMSSVDMQKHTVQ